MKTCEHCGHDADRHSPAYYLCDEDCDCDKFEGQSNWTVIESEDDLPKTDGEYLITDNIFNVQIACLSNKVWSVWDNDVWDAYIDIKPLAWMRLPNAYEPKEKEL